MAHDMAVRDPQSAEAEDLQAELHDRFRGRISGLRVLVRNGGLVLKGRARTFHVKQLVQHAVMKRSRVPILRNEIAVE